MIQMSTEIEKLYTVREVATILRVKAITVHRWAKSDKIKIIKLPNGSVRIRESELKGLLGGQ
jgi:excisionase family DNA binding protein